MRYRGGKPSPGVELRVRSLCDVSVRRTPAGNPTAVPWALCDPMDVEQTLTEALDHHRAGRSVDAHRLYKRVLAERPDEPDALHLLGLLTADNGNAAAAADLIRRAIALRSNVVDYHQNLARVLRTAGQTDEAIDALRAALDVSPTPGVAYELVEVLVAAGRPAEAVGAMERVVEHEPAAESHALLGELLLAAGRLPDAYRSLMRAVQLRPDWPAVHAVLASVQDRQGDLAQAEASYRRALALDEGSPDVCNNLGSVLLRMGRPAEAAELLRRAVALRPEFPQAQNNLGRALNAVGKPDEAAARFRAAVAQAPDFPEAWDGLGRVLLGQRRWADAAAALRRSTDLRPTAAGLVDLSVATGATDDTDAALDALRRAAALAPTSAEVFRQLGATLRWSGQVPEAIAAYLRAIELDPADAAAASGLAYTLLLDDATSPADAFAAHVEWGRRFADTVDLLPAIGDDEGIVDALLTPALRYAEEPDVPPANPGLRRTSDPASPRRLRVGYVSNNFRDSAVMPFVLPILANHDPAAVEVVCYSDTANPDAVTAAARPLASLWRRTSALSDPQLAEQIRADRIDVLVELTGHLGGGRLGTLARRPAPVQVSYLGYQGTTGVAAVDYVITDWHADPAGAELLYVEQPWRLDRPFFCWQPPAVAPPVGPPPVLMNGHVTFGCLNAVAKTSPAAVYLWAQILAAVPGSRMVIMTTRCVATDERIRADFAAVGVSADRVRFVCRAPLAEYLARYDDIDVALDPVPFVGHTTTLDAAWQGVPTVTRAGEGYAQRYGSSAVRAIGLADLVADSDDAYVTVATRLAGDADRLCVVRATLRDAVAASPVADAAGFTRALESAYRAMVDAR